MKIYYHPASTTSRPVMLFALENGIDAELQIVDLFTGEHFKPPYEAINPNHLVPVLEDGDFRLTESSSILKYLADKIDSPAYPKDLRQRARVNERMDWINTQLCRDLAYGFVYPQIFPTHKRPSDEVQAATLAWGKERAKGWLKVLDEHLHRPEQRLSVRRADHDRRLLRCFVRHARRRGPQRLFGLSERQPLARQHEAAQELEQGERNHQRLCRVAEGREAGGRLSTRESHQGELAVIRKLHHNAYRCRDSEETRKFYEDFLGLRSRARSRSRRPRAAARPTRCTPSTSSTTAPIWRSSKLPDMPFEFKHQHDYDLHIALEVDEPALKAMMAKRQGTGIETRGVSDHRFIHSIYFRDPNGYVIELTAKLPGHDRGDGSGDQRRTRQAGQVAGRQGAARSDPNLKRTVANRASPCELCRVRLLARGGESEVSSRCRIQITPRTR